MKKYKLRFFFEHCGPCIWGMNREAKEKYGYAIKPSELPISKELLEGLDLLEQEYHTYLNWESPNEPSDWTDEHKADFIRRATAAYGRLKAELGEEYEVQNELQGCV